MPKISKAAVDKELREQVFKILDVDNIDGIHKINDRQVGVLLTDMNGVQRYVRIGAIVAEERKDITAAELMASEVKQYKDAQEKKRQQAIARKEKAAKDAARREAAKKEKEGE